MYLKNLKLLFCAIVLFFSPLLALAANFEIRPAKMPNVFDVYVANINDPINALSGEVVYDAKNIKINLIKDGGSVVSIWLKTPTAENGSIKFQGLMPGGAGAGRLFSVSLVPIGQVATSTLNANEGTGFLNDGRGTPVKIAGSHLDFNPSGKSEADVGAPVVQDLVPPQDFSVTISRSNKIFNNQWFAVFNAQDQDSGIDHYELAEFLKPTQNIPDSAWQTTVSPYILKNQNVKSYIYVKAVDKAKNTKIAAAVFEPEEKNLAKSSKLVIILAIAFLLVVVGRLFWRREIKKN